MSTIEQKLQAAASQLNALNHAKELYKKFANELAWVNKHVKENKTYQVSIELYNNGYNNRASIYVDIDATVIQQQVLNSASFWRREVIRLGGTIP